MLFLEEDGEGRGLALATPKLHALENVAARLVDLKGLTRPPTFDGRDDGGAEFRWSLENTLTLLGLDTMMRNCVVAEREYLLSELTVDEQSQARVL